MLIKTIIDKADSDIYFSGFSTFINPFSYLMSTKNTACIESFDRIYFDGTLAVILFAFLFKKKYIRRSFDFTSVAGPFFNYIKENRLKLAVVGSTEQDINLFIEKIRELYQGIDIVYFRDGYFSKDEQIKIFQHIDESSADYLLVGMGTPQQECFLSAYRKHGTCKNAFTCGGFIHQTASTNNGQYYPVFFDKYNLRWLYRMLDEPKLIKRYLLMYPKALFVIIKDFVKFSRLKNE